MKIKWKSRPNTKKNDCWADAIMFATGISKDTLYKELKPFIDENGGLDNHFFDGYLIQKGFTLYHIEEKCNLKEFIRLYNSHDNHLVIRTYQDKDWNHLLYVSNNTIYDNWDIEERSEYLKDTVTTLFVKEKIK